MRKHGAIAGLLMVVFGAGVYVGGIRVAAQAGSRVIEIRRYTANEGKLEALVKRMRDGEARMFEKHGMKNVLHSVVADGPDAQTTYIYILSHDSRAKAAASWDAFRNDPEWKAFRADSEKNGPLVAKVEGTFVNPTDFSALK
jgi:hypothetical protein